MAVFGGVAAIGDAIHGRIAARGFRRFSPLGRWLKCPDCPAAVAHRHQVTEHRELHYRAGDYDIPEDDTDGEHPSSGPDSR